MADSNKTYFGSPSEIRRRMMMAQTPPAPKPFLPEEYQQVEYITATSYWTTVSFADLTSAITIESGMTFKYTLMSRGLQRNRFYGAAFSRLDNPTSFSPSEELNISSAGVGDLYFRLWGKNGSVGNITGKFIMEDYFNDKTQINKIYDILQTFLYENTGTLGWYFNDAYGRTFEIFQTLYGGMNFYDMQVTNANNELVLQLVPCYRKTDMVGGLYDRINGIFYEITAGGVLGPEIY